MLIAMLGFVIASLLMVPITLLAVVSGIVFDGWVAFAVILAAALLSSALGFVGANVTIPYKERMLDIADQVTDRAALIGAWPNVARLPWPCCAWCLSHLLLCLTWWLVLLTWVSGNSSSVACSASRRDWAQLPCFPIPCGKQSPTLHGKTLSLLPVLAVY